MRYLDPVADVPQSRDTPASTARLVSSLSGRTVALINNTNDSMVKIHARVAEILMGDHGVREVRSYQVPRNFPAPAGTFERIVGECDAALFGLAN